MSKKFTIFVEDKEINVLVSGKGRVETWASIPLEPGLVIAGFVQNEEKVAGLLKEQLKLLHIKTRRVIIGLSGMNSLYRVFSLPELPDSMLLEAVKHEAERAMPIAINDVYISYQKIPSPAGEVKVFVATFPKNTTDSLVKTMQKAGLEPYLMDLAPLAFSRVVGVPRAVLANIHENYMDIVIFIDRVPLVIRSLSLAEVESVQEKLSTIAEELERTIAFYNSTEKEKPLDNTTPVLVCGEMAAQPENLQYISSRLGFNTTVLMPPLEAPEFFNSCQFMVNIGLAFKEREKGAADFSIVNFNALPEFYLPKHISPLNVLAPVSIVVTAGLVIITVVLSTSGGIHTDALKFELSTIQSYLTQQQKEITAGRAKVTQLENELAPLESDSTVLKKHLENLASSHEQIDKDLGTVISSAPSAITFFNTSRSNDRIAIIGVSLDRYSIYEYARNLMNSGQFASVTVDAIDRSVAAPVAPSALGGGTGTGNEPVPNPVPGAEPTPTPEPAPAERGTESELFVMLKWTDNSANEAGFRIHRATDPGFTQNLTKFTVEPNTTTFTDDKELLPGTTYYYRIFAFNIAGESDTSNVISVVTLSIDIPAAPGDLTTVDVKPSQPTTPGGPAPIVYSYTFSITVNVKQPVKLGPPPPPAPTATPVPKKTTTTTTK